MYKKFFGLKLNPFNVNPDPRFLVLSSQAQEALAALTYGIQTRKGFVLLTGEVGTGKTTLINRLLGWLRQQNIATAFVFNSSLNVPELLDFMLFEFGMDCAGMDKSRILLRLNSWLLERYRSGSTAVVIIDEAQNLSEEALEEVRLLTNLETSTAKLLQVVLSGQPELEDKLRQPRLRQLNQRISLRCKTQVLTEAETTKYINCRLFLAGAEENSIFDSQAAGAVFRYSRGIPRLINLICEHALIIAYTDQQKRVCAKTVESVARDLDLANDRGASGTQSSEKSVVQFGAANLRKEVPFQDRGHEVALVRPSQKEAH